MSRTQASLVVALQLEAVYLLHLGTLEVAYIQSYKTDSASQH